MCRHRRTIWLVASLLPIVASAETAHSGRIDLYAVNNAIELGQLDGTPGATLGDCPWLGEGKARCGASCEARLDPRGTWRQVWVSFVPLADGAVEVDLQGEWYPSAGPGDVRLVWADQVAIEGEAVAAVNGSFEQAGEAGPAGWRFTGAFPPERYRRNGTVAHDGRNAIAVWYGCQARQRFEVRAGRRYRVSAWFRVFAVDQEAIRMATRIEALRPQLETYEQHLTLTLRDAAATARAQVSILPLLRGATWAVSSRWDDNNLADLKMSEVLARHGYRGNFYLNGTERGFYGDPYGLDGGEGAANIDRKLVAGGCQIGGHSWTHPMLAWCNRNRIFEEVLRNRIDREVSSQSPLNSYAFSFCNFTNALEGQVVHADIADVLLRSGYLHVANAAFVTNLDPHLALPASWLLPADGLPIDEAFERLLHDEAARAANPNITFDMHVWYKTPEAWAAFEDQLDRYGRRPDWWYCTQNEYAAYRTQLASTQVVVERDGARLDLRLQRPVLSDLGSDVPLTLALSGISNDDVLGVAAGDAVHELVPHDGDGAWLDLGHEASQHLPAAYGWIADERTPRGPEPNADLPAVDGALSSSDGGLRLVLRNAGDRPLQHLRLTYRLPLACAPGVVWHHLPDLAPGAEQTDTLQLSSATNEANYVVGPAFYAVQADFAVDGRPVRLYLTCRTAGAAADPSCPRDGFLRLGPIPADVFSLDAAATVARGAEPPAGWPAWQSADPATREMLHVEVIPTSGQWGHGGGPDTFYLLRSVVDSEVDQEVAVQTDRGTVDAVFVGGTKVEGATVRLARGENQVLLVSRCSGTFRPGNAGAWLRLADPATGERRLDLRYRSR